MNPKTLAIVGGVVLVLAALVGLSFLGEDSQTPVARLSQNQIGEVAGDDQLFFIEAIDFECPACAGFHPLMKHLRDQYQDRIVFQTRHYPLRAIHLNAGYAHRVAEAAAMQDKFWQMHDLLFEERELWANQAETGLRVDPIPAVEQFANQLGLDWDRLQIDLKSTEVNDIINNDIAWVNRNTERRQTPTFFLQRGVDGPVEVIPSQTINNLDSAIAVFDGWVGPADGQTETSDESNPDQTDELTNDDASQDSAPAS